MKCHECGALASDDVVLVETPEALWICFKCRTEEWRKAPRPGQKWDRFGWEIPR